MNAMEVVFVRHGKADYRIADERRLSSIETNFSPLDRDSISEVFAAADDPRLLGAEIMLTSPYTRALQTAEILNRRLGLELIVEFNLHEWKGDLAGGYIDRWERDRRWAEYQRLRGEYPAGETRPWETYRSLRERVRSVLDRYAGSRKIVIVGHGTAIQSQAGWELGIVPFAGIVEVRM